MLVLLTAQLQLQPITGVAILIPFRLIHVTLRNVRKACAAGCRVAQHHLVVAVVVTAVYKLVCMLHRVLYTVLYDQAKNNGSIFVINW